MPSNRIGRINEEIQRELAALIPRLKDPRVNTVGMVSVTRTDTTNDLRYCKVYISVLDKAKEEIRRRFPAPGVGTRPPTALYAGITVSGG